MNKTAIKNFAIWARVQLIEAAKQRAFEYEITENGDNKNNVESIGGRLLSVDEKEQRKQLISQIQRKGYSQVMEEAAYTWFNRFIALRFMEVNGYLPSKIRVFTDENGAFKPEILKEAMSVELDGLDRNKVLNLLDKQDNEALYKYLLITQCNALNAGLPYMFEKIANWTELLFPANLLRNDSIVGQMISEIPEEDWTDAVQIIGWMYQYYNSDLKDETFALLKKNVKISKERIPAVTQLFTPDWIVRYMVENSLGRLWYEGHSDFDKSQWIYYLEEADQEPEVEEQLKKIRAEYANIRPEDIKVIDPCMGSGHILVYAFDVLMQIYTSAGWSERDAAKSILENNLYGLDIDDRAGQLAYFAVMMKARKYSRRILNGDAKPNVLAIQDSSFMTDELIDYVAGKDIHMKADLVTLRKTFNDAKEYGSILSVPTMQYDVIYERIEIISRSYAEDLFQAQYQLTVAEKLRPLVKQSQIMSQKYDVTVTNPPYMSPSPKQKPIIDKQFPDSKADLFAVFIEKCGLMLRDCGYQAMITQHAWMFLSSFEKLRTKLLHIDTVNMAHLGPRAFDEIGGEVVQTTSFVMRKNHIRGYTGTYCRLVDASSENRKRELFLSKSNRYYPKQDEFSVVPGAPIAYWVSESFLNTFRTGIPLTQIAPTRKGMFTGNNDLWLKVWFEIDSNKLFKSQKPYNKGGEYRKCYGNNDYVVNWGSTGAEIKNYDGSGNINESLYFRKCVTWSLINSYKTSFRAIIDDCHVMGDAGQISLTDSNNQFYILALLNSKYVDKVAELIAPTINFSNGAAGGIPVVIDSEKKISVEELSKQCVDITKQDWDSFESSWDFKKHPLI